VQLTGVTPPWTLFRTGTATGHERAFASAWAWDDRTQPGLPLLWLASDTGTLAAVIVYAASSMVSTLSEACVPCAALLPLGPATVAVFGQLSDGAVYQVRAARQTPTAL